MSNPEKEPLTEAQFLAKLKVTLRKCWQQTTRMEFIRKMRRPNRSHTGYRKILRCVECDNTYGQTEKIRFQRVDGSFSKKPTAAIQVDHIDGLPKLETLDDVGEFVKALFYGPCQILCTPCHKKKTKSKRKEK